MYEILACNRNLDIKSFLTRILVVTASVCVCVRMCNWKYVFVCWCVCVCVIGNRYLCVVGVCVCV